MTTTLLPNRSALPRARWSRPAALVLVTFLCRCGDSASEPAEPPETAGRSPAKDEAVDLEAELEALRAIGYTQWEDAGEERRTGVTTWDKERTQPGYNLLTNDANKAYLMDLGGAHVHTWNFGERERCEYVHLRADGSVVAVFVDSVVAAFDWDSNLLWSKGLRPHHDVAEAPDGTLWMPFHRKFQSYQGRRVRFDGLAHLSADGEPLGRWLTFDHLESLQQLHEPSGLDVPPSQTPKRRYDYYHMNSVQVLPETGLGRDDSRFRAGNLLIHLRNVNLTLILDPDDFEVLWTYGVDTLDQAHAPRMLPGGTILIFDNGTVRKWSRVLEIDPVSKEVVWEYQSVPKERFFSLWQGNAQRLANGNTLICEATRGRVFEVTPEGETVWQYFHALRKNVRKTVYRVDRVPHALVDPLLSR